MDAANFNSHVPLHEYVGPLMTQNRGPWVLDVFTPAPEDEVEQMKGTCVREWIHISLTRT